ncbi:hypothetical protein BDR06DRAFT_1020540 [Suillus hirtellus]|nr:hypothetical protein BDR06DRAFT_1020540 [Suillus hirtellus]
MLTCSTEQDIIQVSRCHPPKEIYSNPGPTHIPPDQQRLIFMGEPLLHPSLPTIDNYDELYPLQRWEDPGAYIRSYPSQWWGDPGAYIRSSGPSTSFGASPSPTHVSATPFPSTHDVPPPTIGPFPHVAIAPSTGTHYAPPGALGSPSQIMGTKRHFAASPAPLPAPPQPFKIPTKPPTTCSQSISSSFPQHLFVPSGTSYL